MKKDTIYVDIDDEITNITDKVVSSAGDVIALVLPKRCTVLQSSVNMKILNKTADQAGKKIVLITSETSLLALAGAAGVYVAKTLQSQPAIPSAPDMDDKIDTISEGEETLQTDPTKSIGELAAKSAVVASAVSEKEDDAPIDLGDEPESDPTDKNSKPEKSSKNKKLKVPNFNKFRTIFFIGIGVLMLLIIAWIVANNILPRAKVTVTTTNSSIPVSFNATGNTTANSVDVSNNIVPAQNKSDQNTSTQQFTATGQQNNGNKATGTMTVTNCIDDGNSHTLPAGTVFTSGNITFVTDQDLTLSASLYSGSKCMTQIGSAYGFVKTVSVTASSPGSQYNLAATNYSTATSGISGSGSNMGGGTDNIITVVSQTDCSNAESSLQNTKTSSFKSQISKELTTAGLVPLTDSFNLTAGTSSCTPAVGSQATTATASVQFNFSMIGVSKDGLNQLIDAAATSQIKGSQSVVDTGLGTADIVVTGSPTSTSANFSVQTNVEIGVKEDASAVAKSIAGQKYGTSMDTIEGMTGVSSVKITYSPFWVSGTPKNTNHISVKFINNGS